MENVTGKVVLITGAVSGIGLGIAKSFATAGANIALGYRREDHLQSAMQWFAGQGLEDQVLPIKLDVSDPKSWRNAADAIRAHFGKLHILCNNAGVNFIGTVDKATDDDWDWVMGVNFKSLIHSVRACLPLIREHGEGGHVLNVTSMAAFLPSGEVGLYSVSKFAARGFTEALRPALASENIGVTELTPGLTRSNIAHSMTNRPDDLADSSLQPDAAMIEMFDGIMQVGMAPEEVGRKALAGVLANRPLVISHPEFREELAEEFDAILAACPDEPVPEERMALEEGRRAAKKGGGGLIASE